jgi:hypothetical protein
VRPTDADVVVGVRGAIAPPELCNGLMVPIVMFEFTPKICLWEPSRAGPAVVPALRIALTILPGRPRVHALGHCYIFL